MVRSSHPIACAQLIMVEDQDSCIGYNFINNQMID